jgi:dipeptidyl aminopeptidase/acylaminoacyl peptidase
VTQPRLPFKGHNGIAWARDGRSIVYGATPGLWRVGADGASPPERLELAGRGAGSPAVASGRDRLVFSRGPGWDPDIYALRPGSPPKSLVQSTFADQRPHYSPDGRRIAFESDRADDTLEIWLVDADGSSPTRLTRGPGRWQAYPRWSPDGRSIAFESQADDGRIDVWTMGVDGSGLRQLTHDPADERYPSWSRDGRYVYFTSNRTGQDEAWRVSVAEGKEELDPREPAGAQESLDGRLLYSLRSSDRALLARPTAGGEARVVSPCVDNYMYAPVPGGVFYFECLAPGNPTGRHSLRRWDSGTGRDQLVASVDASFLFSLTVAPDGQTVLYGDAAWGTSDLMMIENFR